MSWETCEGKAALHTRDGSHISITLVVEGTGGTGDGGGDKRRIWRISLTLTSAATSAGTQLNLPQCLQNSLLIFLLSHIFTSFTPFSLNIFAAC